MASSSEASCISDPNFAVICAFLERFAKSCGITYPAFVDLQEMLENVEQVPQELIDLHIKLLRKARKTVFIEKWERALIKFCHTYSSQDGWEIERFGYKKSRLEVKLRVLKALLEGQFDLNSKFKSSVNEISSEELRSKPIGKDKLGRTYWLQFDPSSNVRVYREDLDDESWTLVAKDRPTFIELLRELCGNEIPLDLLNEESTSVEVEKPILDTGQSSNSSTKNDKIPLDQNNFKNGDTTEEQGTEEEKEIENEKEKDTDKDKEDEEEEKEKEKNPLKTEENEKYKNHDSHAPSVNGVVNEDTNKVDLSSKNECEGSKEAVVTSGKHSQEDDGNQASKRIKLNIDVEDMNTGSDIKSSSPLSEPTKKEDPKEVIVGEAVEEPVFVVVGEGSGAECNTGNPDREKESSKDDTNTENSSNTDIVLEKEQEMPSEVPDAKKLEADLKPTPRLWSIDTICGTAMNSNSGGSEGNEGKDKQKSFSNFAIANVLEKDPNSSALPPSEEEKLQNDSSSLRKSDIVSKKLESDINPDSSSVSNESVKLKETTHTAFVSELSNSSIDTNRGNSKPEVCLDLKCSDKQDVPKGDYDKTGTSRGHCKTELHTGSENLLAETKCVLDASLEKGTEIKTELLISSETKSAEKALSNLESSENCDRANIITPGSKLCSKEKEVDNDLQNINKIPDEMNQNPLENDNPDHNRMSKEFSREEIKDSEIETSTKENTNEIPSSITLEPNTSESDTCSEFIPKGSPNKIDDPRNSLSFEKEAPSGLILGQKFEGPEATSKKIEKEEETLKTKTPVGNETVKGNLKLVDGKDEKTELPQECSKINDEANSSGDLKLKTKTDGNEKSKDRHVEKFDERSGDNIPPSNSKSKIDEVVSKGEVLQETSPDLQLKDSKLSAKHEEKSQIYLKTQQNKSDVKVVQPVMTDKVSDVEASIEKNQSDTKANIMCLAQEQKSPTKEVKDSFLTKVEGPSKIQNESASNTDLEDEKRSRKEAVGDDTLAKVENPSELQKELIKITDLEDKQKSPKRKEEDNITKAEGHSNRQSESDKNTYLKDEPKSHKKAEGPSKVEKESVKNDYKIEQKSTKKELEGENLTKAESPSKLQQETTKNIELEDDKKSFETAVEGDNLTKVESSSKAPNKLTRIPDSKVEEKLPKKDDVIEVMVPSKVAKEYAKNSNLKDEKQATKKAVDGDNKPKIEASSKVPSELEKNTDLEVESKRELKFENSTIVEDPCKVEKKLVKNTDLEVEQISTKKATDGDNLTKNEGPSKVQNESTKNSDLKDEQKSNKKAVEPNILTKEESPSQIAKESVKSTDSEVEQKSTKKGVEGENLIIVEDPSKATEKSANTDRNIEPKSNKKAGEDDILTKVEGPSKVTKELAMHTNPNVEPKSSKKAGDVDILTKVEGPSKVTEESANTNPNVEPKSSKKAGEDDILTKVEGPSKVTKELAKNTNPNVEPKSTKKALDADNLTKAEGPSKVTKESSKNTDPKIEPKSTKTGIEGDSLTKAKGPSKLMQEWTKNTDSNVEQKSTKKALETDNLTKVEDPSKVTEDSSKNTDPKVEPKSTKKALEADNLTKVEDTSKVTKESAKNADPNVEQKSTKKAVEADNLTKVEDTSKVTKESSKNTDPNVEPKSTKKALETDILTKVEDPSKVTKDSSKNTDPNVEPKSTKKALETDNLTKVEDPSKVTKDSSKNTDPNVEPKSTKKAVEADNLTKAEGPSKVTKESSKNTDPKVEPKSSKKAGEVDILTKVEGPSKVTEESANTIRNVEPKSSKKAGEDDILTKVEGPSKVTKELAKNTDPKVEPKSTKKSLETDNLTKAEDPSKVTKESSKNTDPKVEPKATKKAVEADNLTKVEGPSKLTMESAKKTNLTDEQKSSKKAKEGCNILKLDDPSKIKSKSTKNTDVDDEQKTYKKEEEGPSKVQEEATKILNLKEEQESAKKVVEGDNLSKMENPSKVLKEPAKNANQTDEQESPKKAMEDNNISKAEDPSKIQSESTKDTDIENEQKSFEKVIEGKNLTEIGSSSKEEKKPGAKKGRPKISKGDKGEEILNVEARKSKDSKKKEDIGNVDDSADVCDNEDEEAEGEELIDKDASKTDKENSAQIGRGIRKKKKEMLPQRVLSRNRTRSIEKQIEPPAKVSKPTPVKKGRGRKPSEKCQEQKTDDDGNEEADDDDDGKEEISYKKKSTQDKKAPKSSKIQRKGSTIEMTENDDERYKNSDDSEKILPIKLNLRKGGDPVVVTPERISEPQRKSRKRRSCATNSISDEGSNNQDAEEHGGGKRIKMRPKKKLHSGIRKSVEEKRERRVSSSSSEDEDKGKKENKEKIIEKETIVEEKKVRKKGRPRKGEEQPKKSPVNRPAQSREMKLLGITEFTEEITSVRQSRRIAQIKLKEEAERRMAEELQLESYKKKDKDKKNKSEKRKRKKKDDSDVEEPEDEPDSDEKVKEKKKKKKKDKLKFDELKPWQSTSGSSSSADDEDDEIEDDVHEDEELVFKSDHEFSPESDVEDPEYKPIKRARTAKVDVKDIPEAGVGVASTGAYDDTSCEKCARNDHPEWILLCDKCDKGWHASCLRPALMVVPEGDWFCPPCEHSALIVKLKDSLAQYDRCQKQRENEELRKKRLAFVGINLDNVLPLNKKDKKAKTDDKRDESGSGSGSASSDSGSSSTRSESSSDESEPVYQLRERRSNVTSYRYSEYDELIKSALQEEIELVQGAGNSGKGKDISNIVNAEKEEDAEKENELGSVKRNSEGTGNESELPSAENDKKVEGKPKEKRDVDADYEAETEDDDKGDDDDDDYGEDERPPVVPRYDKKGNRKKSRSVKITSLDFTSEEEDNNSDSDFKGSSSEEESEGSLASDSESSDGVRRKRRGFDGPLRRSTRARISRYDKEFINDDTDDEAPRKKKSRHVWASSESSDSDRSWGRRKKKTGRSPRKVSTKRKSKGGSKKKKNKKRIVDSDSEGEKTPKKPKNRRIKYGGLDELDEEKVLTKRTRGRKMNYQEDNESDSDDELRKAKARSARIIESDDEFNAEEEKEDEKELSEEETDDDVNEDHSFDDDDSIKRVKRKEENGKVEKSEPDAAQIEKSKKRSVIPDPDDFSENDLAEDEELDEFAEELEDLEEDEKDILGEMLQDGDVPVRELKSAVQKAKEGRKLKNQVNETAVEPEVNRIPPENPVKTFPPIPAHLENIPPTTPKFHKIGKMKITPSRSELKASILAGQTPESLGINPSNPLYKEITNCSNFVTEQLKNVRKIQDLPPKVAIPEILNPSALLMKSLQTDPQKVHDQGVPLNSANIPLKDDIKQAPPGFPPYVLNPTPVLGVQPGMLPLQVNNGPPQPFNNFQGIMSPRMPPYSSNLPTTVAGLANAEAQQRRKPGPKPGIKSKRKQDDSLSPNDSDDGDEGSLPSDDLSKVKGLEDSPKRKSRGRGKKQLLAESQAQGKQDVTIATVQAPTQFPPQGLVPEGGSVITRMLNTPQGPQTFPPGGRPPFRPSTPIHYSNQGRSPMRLRPPPPGTIYHTSHPMDPSPSGGGAINITPNPTGPHHISKPSPATFTRAPPPVQSIPPIIPPFPNDPAVRPPFAQGSPPQNENFPGFQNFYGNFPQQPPPAPPIAGSEESLPSSTFQSSPYPEQFEENQGPEAGGNKPQFDEETGGEFGGLASYFASQREDDLDT